MKIGILTQALHSNYGGLLQNYALQQVLLNMGHEPETIDRHICSPPSRLKDMIKWIIRHIKNTYDISLLSSQQKEILTSLQKSFVDTNINHTPKIHTQAEFEETIRNRHYDAYIVGSDQCWRPCYSANIYNYYLDFADDNVRKVAYAASFGVDNWEYSDKSTSIVGDLAKKIDAISVRENTAVTLCKEKLGVKATWVLDPTMLLGKSGFMKFIIPEKKQPYILHCLLEESPVARKLVSDIAFKMEVTDIVSNISSPIFHRSDSLYSHLNISVEQWLSNIYNASIVVTDSFHGAVFCILFNVPFIVWLNAVRGNSRLESLLTDFELMDCICKDVNNIVIPKFDWPKINIHLSERQMDSISFLNHALS